MVLLEIKNLTVKVEGKLVLESLNVDVDEGNVEVLLGPNGAGKSTLLGVIMGNPKYHVVAGDIIFEGESILGLSVEERAKKGIFMAFQHPVEIPGVSLVNFLRTSYKSVVNPDVKMSDFSKLLKEKMKFLEMDTSFRGRHVNSGFSGGEKKRSELLQMLLLEPKLLLLDEIDSGVDVDAMKVISKSLQELKNKGSTILLISHHNSLLKEIVPQKVTILKQGSIDSRGGQELLEKVELEGFN